MSRPKQPTGRLASFWGFAVITAVALVTLLLGGATVYEWWLEHLGLNRAEAAHVTEVIGAYAVLIVSVLALTFGLARTGSVHPVRNARYLAWLELTPWQRGVPLPLGPVLLTWTDLVGLASLIVVSVTAATFWYWRTSSVGVVVGLSASAVALAAVVGYCIGVVYTLFFTNRNWEVAAILVGLGAVLRLVPNLWLGAAILVALVALAQWGLWRGLGTYPWKPGKKPPVTTTGLDRVTRVLGPVEEDRDRHLRTARLTTVASAIAGWWIYVIAALVLRSDPVAFGQDNAWMLTTGIGGLAALSRWGRYLSERRGPMGWISRLRSGLYLFPKWDVVHVGPVLTVATGYYLPGLLIHLGATLPVAVGLALPATLAVAIWCPPSLRTWNLTGGWSMSMSQLQPRTRNTAKPA